MMSTSLGLEGKHILVTGAAGGLGLESVKLLAAHGAKLTITDLAPVDGIVAELRASGTDIEGFSGNLTESFEVDPKRIEDLYGVVFLAGIFLTQDWMQDDDWEATFNRVMDINVVSMLRVLRVCMPVLERHRDGRVVLVGSSAGRMGGDPDRVQPHYAVSRGGIHSMIYNMAKRYSPLNIRVNGVAPGTIATEDNIKNFRPGHVFAAGRMGKPNEVAWPITFLCSPHASYICGHVLDVNGGSYMV